MRAKPPPQSPPPTPPPPRPVRRRAGASQKQLNIFNGLRMGKLDGRAALGKLPGARVRPWPPGKGIETRLANQLLRGRTQRSQPRLHYAPRGAETHGPHRSGEENGRRRRS